MATERDPLEIRPTTTHPLFLGQRWGKKAERNIDRWGHQRLETILLAAIEELGEIAHELQWQSNVGDIDQNGGPRYPHADGRDLIDEMAGLGVRTRSYLEDIYSEPAGDGDGIEDLVLYENPADLEPIRLEIEDLAPLCYQLYWAIERLGSGGAR